MSSAMYDNGIYTYIYKPIAEFYLSTATFPAWKVAIVTFTKLDWHRMTYIL